MHNQKTQVEARGDLATLGSNVFWTSAELTATIAKAIIFSSGAILEKSKAETAYVRCVKDYPGLNVDQSSVIAYTDISKEVGFSVDDTYGGVVTVTYTGEESGKFAINSTGDKFIIPANMKPGNYVVTVAAGTTTRVIDLMVASTDNSMRFTIDTRKNTASDVNFMLPFLTDATRALAIQIRYKWL